MRFTRISCHVGATQLQHLYACNGAVRKKDEACVLETAIFELQQMFEIFSVSYRGQAWRQILSGPAGRQSGEGLSDVSLSIKLVNRLATPTWPVGGLYRLAEINPLCVQRSQFSKSDPAH